MKPAPNQIDVVIVPDFTGPRAIVFEARALFFLASWLENYGEGGGGGFRPHLCCIGEPPESVRRLAARAPAGISVHEPLLVEYGGFANKLRGLETRGQGERILLLDADIMVLGKLEWLGEVNADMAAVRAGKPQVPESQWRLIYAALGLPVPSERIASVHGAQGARLDHVAHPYQEQETEAAAMLPYYNSGTLLLRRDCELRGVWETYLQRIPALFRELAGVVPAHAVLNGDQVALATSIQALRGRGYSFTTLPDAYNARLTHFRTGALCVDDTRLLHAAGFAGAMQARGEIHAAVTDYERRWCEAIGAGAKNHPVQATRDAERAHSFLWNLWERWVREAWSVR